MKYVLWYCGTKGCKYRTSAYRTGTVVAARCDHHGKHTNLRFITFSRDELEGVNNVLKQSCDAPPVTGQELDEAV